MTFSWVENYTLIARFMGPTWGPSPTGPRWAPCWPHGPCYLGRHGYVCIVARGITHIGVKRLPHFLLEYDEANTILLTVLYVRIIIYGSVCISLPISLTMIVIIRVLYLVIIIKSKVWPICHCIELVRETMACAACLFTFLSHMLVIPQ